jgi:hypothetical protein
MKGTIYGNRLPRGTQVKKKKGWEPLLFVFGASRKDWSTGHVPEIIRRLIFVLQHAAGQ